MEGIGAVPARGRQVSALAVDGEGTLWVADRDGVYYSANKGASWQPLKGLFVRNVNSLFYDEAASRLLVTSDGPATMGFEVATPSMRVSWWDTGWNLRSCVRWETTWWPPPSSTASSSSPAWSIP